MLDPQRIDAAATRFRAFFAELGDAFIEREDVLAQIALALIAREHALLTGPPGTAKSQLAHAVFGRIRCETTGRPSVYARQITESTVQTDLIGPVDFKNLMETGRTTHFTDEGMLGATHAFLDEIFDGRDMLLRSALNVLQERELKEGTTITRGRIEVALMTTNRYIADVLEGSRDTLLAFVDRIAFVGFVPRGFADDSGLVRVLERHVARTSGTRLDALLTLQDLDVLQALCDAVVVSEPMCARLARFLSALDRELHAAVRADPTFVPTRYFSTRTAVRSGRVLRAACVYDRVFRHPERDLRVLSRDLEALRLHLLLSGPGPAAVEALLKRESDPHERRQLEILRTEREIFERCLATLPPPEPEPPASRRVGSVPAPGDARAAAPVASKSDASPAAFAGEEEAIGSGDVERVCRAIATLLPLASADTPASALARALLDRAVGVLRGEALATTLHATGMAATLDGAMALARLAATVPDASASLHDVARFLRSRALAALEEVARFGPPGRGVALGEVDPRVAVDETKRRLGALEELAALRAPLRDAVDDVSGARWGAALDAVEADLAALWDAALATTATALRGGRATALSDALRALDSDLAAIDDASARLSALRGAPCSFKALAAGPRITSLVSRRMASYVADDRRALQREIDEVLALLARARVAMAVTPDEWLRWSAEAIARGNRVPTIPATHSYGDYRALRAAEQREPATLVLAEIALRVPRDHDAGRAPADFGDLAAVLARLPAATQETIVTLDLERIARAVGYLEAFWSTLVQEELPAPERLAAIVRSRLFDLLWDEEAVARFAAETRLVAELWPAHTARAEALRERIAAFDERTRSAARGLLRERTDAAWRAALGSD